MSPSPYYNVNQDRYYPFQEYSGDLSKRMILDAGFMMGYPLEGHPEVYLSGIEVNTGADEILITATVKEVDQDITFRFPLDCEYGDRVDITVDDCGSFIVGYMVVGELAESIMSSFPSLEDDGSLDDGSESFGEDDFVFEPGVSSILFHQRVNYISLANDPNISVGDNPDIPTSSIVKEFMWGDIEFVPGKNCKIESDKVNNTIRVIAARNAGEGSVGNIDIPTEITCSDLVNSISGAKPVNGNINIKGGTGITVQQGTVEPALGGNAIHTVAILLAGGTDTIICIDE